MPGSACRARFTYIWTHEGSLYFAVVLDLFSRLVVGWSMSSRVTAQLVTDALVMAVWRRGKPEALLHHSDQGSQYASEQFQRLLADHGITCSMSRAGDVWDNSAMESFFSSLKIERVNRRVYATRNEAKADVFDYVERFYNPRRRHSTHGVTGSGAIQFAFASFMSCARAAMNGPIFCSTSNRSRCDSWARNHQCSYRHP
jgi:putative transposase